MGNTEKFLSAYKDYETLLRTKDIDPKDYEDQSSELTGGRLRMCRMFRNYFAHNNDAKFLTVSDVQLGFIEKQALALKLEGDIVKKHIIKPALSTCTDKDKCIDVMQKFEKLKKEQIIVIKENGYSIARVYDVAALALESKTKKISDVKQTGKIHFISPEDSMVEIANAYAPGTMLVCTQDGTAKGNFLGILYL